MKLLLIFGYWCQQNSVNLCRSSMETPLVNAVCQELHSILTEGTLFCLYSYSMLLKSFQYLLKIVQVFLL